MIKLSAMEVLAAMVSTMKIKKVRRRCFFKSEDNKLGGRE